ncbi:hypothetical protein RIF23_17195 [Lipingzhangella sp. LS1_29]|uniref:Septum formation-related domain-containing protein n=1 Tax=Lipingzhangella rawalii TaxID=2055835 RepID=A0ABU2H9U0_9ACTN|nr:hypothetical protein [Lipingzhangella rawalii]MDS1272028.1 hypothetical protein [Lipingzhangella rawalii]
MVQGWPGGRPWRGPAVPNSGVWGSALVGIGLLVAGCGGSDGAAEGAAQIPEEAPSPDTTFDEVMPAVESPPEGFDMAEFQGVRVDVPEGWEIDDGDDAMCVRPPGQEECRFGAFLVFPSASERQDESWPAEHFDEDDGWAPNPERCRSFATASDVDGDVGIGESDLVVQDFGEHPAEDRDDGVRRSHFRQWDVTCENEDTFAVRLWYLPQSDVAAYVWSVDEQYSETYTQIAESMNIDDYLD